MNHKDSMRRPKVLLVGGLILLLAGLSASVAPAAAGVPSGPPSDLRDALGAHGFLVTDVADAEPAATSAQSALDVAQANFPTGGQTTVYLASLTDMNWHVGAEDTSLAIRSRAVYVVQFSGLELRPLGGGRGDPPPATSANHHELVVFVDATSGEFLVATTVR